jgi:hypothetical protein
MVSYLKKFSNLQALNIADNPFCKEDTSMQIQLEQQLHQKSIVYPASYDVILANLDKLKYIDWKPIDIEKRETASVNYKNSNQKDRNDANAQNEEMQQTLMKEHAKYRHANIEATIDFYKDFEKKIKDDLIANAVITDPWESLHRIPGFENCLSQTKKLVDESLEKYRKDILDLQAEKDDIIKIREKEIKDGHEKFVEQSKSLVNTFKREFKTKTLNQPPKSINREKMEMDIKTLTDKLFEIELHEKKQIGERIITLRDELTVVNDKMANRTSYLKEELESHKKYLKENLQNMQQDLDKRVQEYEAQPDEYVDKAKHEEMKFFKDALEEDSLWTEIERINETYEEKVSSLVKLL